MKVKEHVVESFTDSCQKMRLIIIIDKTKCLTKSSKAMFKTKKKKNMSSINVMFLMATQFLHYFSLKAISGRDLGGYAV